LEKNCNDWAKRISKTISHKYDKAIKTISEFKEANPIPFPALKNIPANHCKAEFLKTVDFPGIDEPEEAEYCDKCQNIFTLLYGAGKKGRKIGEAMKAKYETFRVRIIRKRIMSFMQRLGFKNKFRKMDDKFATMGISDVKTGVINALGMNNPNHQQYFGWMDNIRENAFEDNPEYRFLIYCNLIMPTCSTYIEGKIPNNDDIIINEDDQIFYVEDLLIGEDISDYDSLVYSGDEGTEEDSSQKSENWDI